MPYKVIYSDLCSIKCDAIVNSLGVDSEVYGAICQDVISRANSQELKNYIDNLTDLQEGMLFLTDSGQISTCSNIIHVVTPFKDDDDFENTNLKNTIKNIIEFARSNNFKKIALPFIGTGYNGYSKEEALKVILEVCYEIELYEEKHKKEYIDLVVCIYLSQYQQYTSYDCLMCPPSKDDLFDVLEFLNDINEDELIPISPVKYEYPYDFIEDFIYHFNIDDRRLTTLKGIDRRRKNQFKRTKNLKTIDMLRLAVCFNMTKTQFIQFLLYSGKSLSPKSEIDLFCISYFNGEYEKVDNVIFLDELLYDNDIYDIYDEYK